MEIDARTRTPQSRITAMRLLRISSCAWITAFSKSILNISVTRKRHQRKSKAKLRSFQISITALLPVPVQPGSCPKRTTSVKLGGIDKNGFSQCFSFDEISYTHLGGGSPSTDANTSRCRVKQKKNPAPPFAKFFLDECHTGFDRKP